MGWEIDLLGSEDVGAEGATKLSWGAIANTMLAMRPPTSGDLLDCLHSIARLTPRYLGDGLKPAHLEITERWDGWI